jgi:hypothetical protein
MAESWMQPEGSGSTIVKHKGALRRKLHVKEGEKIPAAKLEKATHSENPATRKQAALAKVFRGAHHNAGGYAHAAPGQKMAHQHSEGHAHMPPGPGEAPSGRARMAPLAPVIQMAEGNTTHPTVTRPV